MSVPNTIKVDVHIWTLDVSDAELAALERLLCADERTRAARFFHRQDAARWTVSRGRMRQALGAATASDPACLIFAEEPHGRPTMSCGDSALSFNLSHSGALGCLALCWQARVGVDIEQTRSLNEDEMNWPLSAAERSVLATCSRAAKTDRFFRFWTLKEAFMKADGRGASLPTDSFDIGWSDAGDARLLQLHDQPEAPAQWRFSEHSPLPDYHAALAAKTDGHAVSVAWHDIC